MRGSAVRSGGTVLTEGRESWWVLVTYKRYHRIRIFASENCFFFEKSRKVEGQGPGYLRPEKQRTEDGASFRGAGRGEAHVPGIHPVIIGQAMPAKVLLPSRRTIG